MKTKVLKLKIEANPFVVNSYALYNKDNKPVFLIEGYYGSLFTYLAVDENDFPQIYSKCIYESKTGKTKAYIILIEGEYFIYKCEYIPVSGVRAYFCEMKDEFLYFVDNNEKFNYIESIKFPTFVSNKVLNIVDILFYNDKAIIPKSQYENLAKGLRYFDDDLYLVTTYKNEYFLVKKTNIIELKNNIKYKMQEYNYTLDILPPRISKFIQKLNEL